MNDGQNGEESKSEDEQAGNQSIFDAIAPHGISPAELAEVNLRLFEAVNGNLSEEQRAYLEKHKASEEAYRVVEMERRIAHLD